MATITWTDKTDATVSGLAESQKVTAATMAEIKSVTNTNATSLATAESDIVSIETRSGSVPFTYDYLNTTAASDPGSGKFKFNNISPLLATHIYISITEDTRDVSSALALLNAGSAIYFQDRATPALSGVFTFVSVVDNTTWLDITMTVDSASGVFATSSFYAMSIITKPATGAGSGTVTSVSTTASKGLIITGTPTVAPIVDLDRSGTDNFIDASTDLEGTAIDSVDTIVYHDSTDNGVKKGKVSDLPFSNNVGTVTSVTAGTGLSQTGTSTINPTLLIDLLGSDNYIESGTDLEGTSINKLDTIAYNDATDGNVKKGLVDDLPFVQLVDAVYDYGFAMGDEDTDVTASATAIYTGTVPRDMKVSSLIFSLEHTNPVGGTTTFDCKINGTSIFSTLATIDTAEASTLTAATPAVITTGTWSAGDKIEAFLTIIASTTAGKGPKCTVLGTLL